MSNQVTVRRILTYRGNREWVQSSLEKSIHGTKFLSGGICSISAVSLDEFPVKVGPSLRDLLLKELSDAEAYFPDNDDQRAGYIEGVDMCIRLFEDFLKEG